MNSQIAKLIWRNSLAVVVGYVLAFAAVQLAQRAGGWPGTEISQDAAFIGALLIALALRARLIAYVWAALAAFGISELCIHAVYGIRAAQGGPTHFAVMGAAFLAVALGGLVRHTAFAGASR
jgi:hypothetical protein